MICYTHSTMTVKKIKLKTSENELSYIQTIGSYYKICISGWNTDYDKILASHQLVSQIYDQLYIFFLYNMEWMGNTEIWVSSILHLE